VNPIPAGAPSGLPPRASEKEGKGGALRKSPYMISKGRRTHPHNNSWGGKGM